METSLFSPYVRVVFRSCSLEGKDKLFISRPFKKNGVNLGICFFKEWTKWTDLWITKQGSLYDTNPKQGTIFGGNPPKLQETFAASLIPPPQKIVPIYTRVKVETGQLLSIVFFLCWLLYQPTFLGTVFAMSFWPWGNDPYKRPRYKMHQEKNQRLEPTNHPFRKENDRNHPPPGNYVQNVKLRGVYVPCKESFAKRPRYKTWCLVATNSQLWDLLIARDLRIRGRVNCEDPLR